MPVVDSYPIEARVVLEGLVKAPDLNGKVGVVKSALAGGRQQVYVEELSKSVALKVSNLKYEGRSVESLSVKELKAILRSKGNTSDSELTGIDKTDLQSKVAAISDSPEELADLLARSKATPVGSTSKAAPPATSTNASQAADQLSSMSPEQLRQQAQMMRTMDPNTIRRMNPQLANMTNAQIQMAASQMEMMANNPSMMKQAAEQMSNMSPDELQRMQDQVASGTAPMPASTTTNTASTPSPNSSAPGVSSNQATQAANMMANMTPEQLRQQAEMLKNTPPDTIRKTNPQLAHMTDDQIRMAATQFEMMASNPDTLKMAMDQMKNLSPEQLEAMNNGTAGGPPDLSSMGGDPSKLLADMDKTQLKTMLKSVKDNPEMLKQFAGMSGIGEEQLAKGMEMFANMDDDKLDMTLNFMQRAQKAKDVWAQADSKTGGHLMKILIVITVLCVGLFVKWLFSGSAVPGTPTNPVESIPILDPEPVVEDEFAAEF